MKYAVHNPTIGFTLKKHGESSAHVRFKKNSFICISENIYMFKKDILIEYSELFKYNCSIIVLLYCSIIVLLYSQVRTPHNSTKQSNIRILYGNPVARELLEVELDDNAYKFKMQGLVTNPNYTNKRMMMLLFINNRLVDSSCKSNLVSIFFLTFM